VGAPDAPWTSAFEDSFGNVDDAAQALRALPAPDEPSVLRVTVDGRGVPSIALPGVTGDWLLDPEGEVDLLPAPVWRWSLASQRWSAGRTWLDAWETCPSPAWMLWGVADLRAPPTAALVDVQVAFARAILSAISWPGAPEVAREVDLIAGWLAANRSAPRLPGLSLGDGFAARYNAAHGHPAAVRALLLTVANAIETTRTARHAALSADAAEGARLPSLSCPFMVGVVRGLVPTIAALRAAADG
jgi:hypothetical protein